MPGGRAGRPDLRIEPTSADGVRRSARQNRARLFVRFGGFVVGRPCSARPSRPKRSINKPWLFYGSPKLLSLPPGKGYFGIRKHENMNEHLGGEGGRQKPASNESRICAERGFTTSKFGTIGDQEI